MEKELECSACLVFTPSITCKRVEKERDREELTICSVWMLTKTRGAPEETVDENQAMDRVMVASKLRSLGKGMKRMELIRVEWRSGK